MNRKTVIRGNGNLASEKVQSTINTYRNMGRGG